MACSGSSLLHRQSQALRSIRTHCIDLIINKSLEAVQKAVDDWLIERDVNTFTAALTRFEGSESHHRPRDAPGLKQVRRARNVASRTVRYLILRLAHT